MRGMKRRAWGLLLTAVMLVTSVGVGVRASGDQENQMNSLVEVTTNCKILDEIEQDEQQIVEIKACNQSKKNAVIRTYLLEDDRITPEVQTEAVNLFEKEDITDPSIQSSIEESLKDVITLKDGAIEDGIAHWKFETDQKDASRIIARYFEVELPAEATLNYEMHLKYKTDEEYYTKKVFIQTKAFIENQEVTVAADRENETKENEKSLVWSRVQEQIGTDDSTEQKGNQAEIEADRLLNVDCKITQTNANSKYRIYFDSSNFPKDEWFINGNLKIYGFEGTENSGILPMTQDKNTPNLFTCEFDRQWKNVIFLKSDWNSNVKTIDLAIDWNLQTPCFKLTSVDGKQCKGEWFDLKLPDNPGDAFGETMYFVDLRNDTYTYSNVNALFYKKDNNGERQLVEEKTMQMPRQGIFSVTIPADSSYVTFRADGYEIGTYYNFLGETVTAPDEKSFTFQPYYMDAFYYNYDGDDSYWDAYLSSANRSLDDHILYFDTRDLNNDQEKWDENNLTLTYTKKDGTVVTVKSGDGSGKLPKTRTEGIRYYHFPKESGASEYTKFTISDGQHTLRFLYVLQNETNMIRLEDACWSVYSSTGDHHIFFDDTLSQYGTIYYKAWNSNNTSETKSGTMVSISQKPEAAVVKNPDKVFVNSHSDNELIPERYDKIQFWKDNDRSKITTGPLDIERFYDYPCFKANPKNVAKGDSEYYKGGIWKSVLDVNDNGDHSLNVPYAEKKVVENAYYGITTFYDYYSDYELSGKNRKTLGELGYTNERYQPNSVFNMALSDYYRDHSNSNPLYLGHFQWSEDDKFDNMSSRVNLYQFSENREEFLYNNNSVFRKNNKEEDPDVAVQGLVGEKLNNGNLTIGKQDAAFFDEEFLRGNNSKNTAIGYVYNNVQFPFVKNSDDYWEFDSSKSEESLRLKRDAESGYFLDKTGEEVKGFTSGKETPNANFFPFNDPSESGNIDKLNYGFGAKIDIKFRLTEDGKILSSDGKTSKPIVFNFSGDDDVWVYIDGQLALDIGGGHGAVAGQIDFSGNTTEKKAAVSKVKTDYGQNGVSVQEFINQTSKGIPDDCENIRTFSISGSNTDEHTLTMFYMERGLWESNMKITFNFPQENTLKVEKEIDTSNVNAIFAEAMKNMGTFEFDIKNYATHGEPKEVGKPDTPGKELIFNDYSQTNTVSGTGMNGSVVQQDAQEKQFQWYYPGEKKATDGQGVTDQRLAKIQCAKTPDKDLTMNNQLDYEYLEFQVFNEDNRLEGTSPFVALVDADGTRIGEWGSRLTYGGTSNNLGKQKWKTIKIDLGKIQNYVIDHGKNKEFDFSKVKEIQFSYWDDVHLKVGPMVFKKSPKTSHTGFTAEQKNIPDYDSIKANKLMPATGAWYEKSDGNVYVVEDGTFNIGNHESVVFEDQFRRGSYVYVAEKNVNPSVFETRWTIYENDVPVQDGYLTADYFTRNKISSVSLGKDKTIQNVEGTVLDDGRTEINPNQGVIRPEKAIVFRSYKNPDSEATVINLKAKFTNKLKTGNLYIEKSLSQGESSPDQNQEYTFIIEYRNIAGMSLEATLPDGESGYRDSIVQKIKLKAGESMMITGIPAGTDYIITEEKGDNFNLEKIDIKASGNDQSVKVENNVVTGVVVADEPETGTATQFTFVNSLIPAIEIRGTKSWEGNFAEIPNDKSIVVQLQQKKEGDPDSAYQQAKDKAGQIVSNEVVNVNTNWEYFFTNLSKYIDYREPSPMKYHYRVVELGVLKERGELSGVEPDPQNLDHIKPLDGYYPEYSVDSSGNVNILNKKTGSITINKKDENNAPLKGVEFTLYTDDKRTVAKDLNGQEIKAKTNDQGQIFFKNIPSGTEKNPNTYYLKETKTVGGHVLLKDPIKVVLPYKYQKGDIVNGQPVSEDGVTWKLTFTLINDKAFDLPASGTGGITKYLVIGIALAVTAGVTLGLRQTQVRNNKRRRRKHSR